jgi:hypothetical protein
MAEKRALCVGINQFKNFPNAALQGCVNDADNMAALLQEFFGFSPADIVKLTDSQATKANIMENLQEMVAAAKAGKAEYLVFSFSSHGTQVPDISGDEPDKADEAFCPHDLAEAGDVWDPNHIIIDDELHDLFVTLPENVLLEVYLDTCHSGTGLRALDLLLTRRPRYMPPPSLAAFERVEGLHPKGLYRSFLEKGITRHILWAACQPDQTSADAKIGDSWHGAFTYYFCKAIQAGQNKLPRKEVLARIMADLKAERYPQVPRLEGDATNRNRSIG